jgi:hypothetical protein
LQGAWQKLREIGRNRIGAGVCDQFIVMVSNQQVEKRTIIDRRGFDRGEVGMGASQRIVACESIAAPSSGIAARADRRTAARPTLQTPARRAAAPTPAGCENSRLPFGPSLFRSLRSNEEENFR